MHLRLEVICCNYLIQFFSKHFWNYLYSIPPKKVSLYPSYQWVKVSLSFTSLSFIVFRSVSFTHWFSFIRKFFQFFLIPYFSFFRQHLVTRGTGLFQDIIRNIQLFHHPFSQFPNVHTTTLLTL
jgi:hypothetical protein